MGRKSSRRHAFSIIYQLPFHNEGFELWDAAQDYIAGNEISAEDTRFIHELVDGVIRHLPQIDSFVSERAGWGFDRVASVDLAILRIALFEILYSDDAPISVVINEAVELAKTYGTDDSATFVNGLLAQVAKRRVEKNE